MGILTNVKKRWEERQRSKAYERIASKKSRRRALIAYYEAKAGEEEKYAKTKAKVEREQKEKRLKAPKRSFFESINLPTRQEAQSMFGTSSLMGTPQPIKRAMKKRKRVKNVKSKYIIRSGKAYPLG